jgi:hypothetical protein
LDLTVLLSQIRLVNANSIDPKQVIAWLLQELRYSMEAIFPDFDRFSINANNPCWVRLSPGIRQGGELRCTRQVNYGEGTADVIFTVAGMDLQETNVLISVWKVTACWFIDA